MKTLKNEKIWLCWNREGNTKIPKSAFTSYDASYKKEKNLGTFEQAKTNAARWNLSGIGIVLGAGIAGIDLDHCIDESGNLSETAKDILNTVKSYTELSPSKTGLHIIFKYHGNNSSKTNKAAGIEFYTKERYFTFSENVFDNRNTLEDCTAGADAVFEKYLANQKTAGTDSSKQQEILFAQTIQQAQKSKDEIKTYEDAKIYMLEHTEEILTPAEVKNTYICPLCGHGSRENKKGMHAIRNESSGKKYWFCYSCGNENKETGLWNANTFEIVNKVYQLGDNYEAEFKKACELFNIDFENLIGNPYLKIDAALDFSDPFKSDFFYLDAFKEETQKTPREIVSSGFKNLDEVLSGGFYSGLYFLGAIASLGKTTFLLQLAANIAKQNKDVLIFSLEMSRNELISKGVSRETANICNAEKLPLSLAKTTRGIMTAKFFETYSEQEKDLINRAIKEYAKYSNHIYTVEGLGDISHKEIRAALESFIKFTGSIPFVFVDYAQIMAPYNDRATDKQNIDKNILELKRISRDFDTVILCVSSFNRENYNNAVTMQAFKESGAIEYSSDVLIGIQLQGAGTKDKKGNLIFNVDQAKQKEPREIEIKILKNRNGKTGTTLNFNYYAKFNLFTESKTLEHGGEQLRREILNIVEQNQNGNLLLFELCEMLEHKADTETVKFILENNGFKVTAGGYIEAAKGKTARERARILDAFEHCKDGANNIASLLDMCEFLEVRKTKLKKDIQDLYTGLEVKNDLVRIKNGLRESTESDFLK